MIYMLVKTQHGWASVRIFSSFWIQNRLTQHIWDAPSKLLPHETPGARDMNSSIPVATPGWGRSANSSFGHWRSHELHLHLKWLVHPTPHSEIRVNQGLPKEKPMVNKLYSWGVLKGGGRLTIANLEGKSLSKWSKRPGWHESFCTTKSHCSFGAREICLVSITHNLKFTIFGWLENFGGSKYMEPHRKMCLMFSKFAGTTFILASMTAWSWPSCCSPPNQS